MHFSTSYRLWIWAVSMAMPFFSVAPKAIPCLPTNDLLDLMGYYIVCNFSAFTERTCKIREGETPKLADFPLISSCRKKKKKVVVLELVWFEDDLCVSFTDALPGLGTDHNWVGIIYCYSVVLKFTNDFLHGCRVSVCVCVGVVLSTKKLIWKLIFDPLLKP